MDDVSVRFLDALSTLDRVADEVTPDKAAAVLDDAALQDLAGPSSAFDDDGLDEVGGEGG